MPRKAEGPEEAARLPDEAVVVRGGVITPKGLASALEVSFREDGVYELSVCASAELAAHDLAQWVRERDPECQRLPHKRMQQSTAGAIRSVGADVLLTPPPEGHYSIRFDAVPADEQIAALVAAFDAPEPNPVPKGK